jgi:outer membrane protein TolC
MSSAIKVVKRKDREPSPPACAVGTTGIENCSKGEIVRRVKTWVAESRSSRQAEAKLALQFLRGLDVRNGPDHLTQVAKSYLTTLLVVGLIILSAHGATRAQSSTPSTESLTLDQAIDLALQNNRLVKIAQLGVDRADEDVSVAKTFRFPSLHTYTLFSGNLAKNEIQVANPAANLFPGLGSFFALTPDRKPTAIFAVSAIQPVSQQYRIGLHIKLEKLAREVGEAKLRQQQNDTVDEVKKAYYAILQTKSALSSEREALKAYQQLDKVTGDYVVQQVALKADYLVVQTRLARSQYEELELSNKLATQKEQLNSLLGHDVTT